MTTIASRAHSEPYTWGGDCDGWHLLAAPDLSVIEEQVPPGRGEVRHYHRHARQFFYVLSGVASLEVDGDVFELHPREGREVPPGRPHSLHNNGDEPLCFLVISTPPSHGDRVSAEHTESAPGGG